MERGFEEQEAGDARGGDPGQDRPAAEARSTPPRRCPPPPAPAGAESSRPTPDEVADHFAGHLAETSASAFMYFSMAGVFRQADALAYKKFRDRLLAECGGPSDPIEIMMIEELALAHLNVGRLHFRSAATEGLDEARTCGALAIALAGEFRRMALAIKAYRVRPQFGAEAGGPMTPAGEAVPDEGGDGELGTERGGDERGEDTIPLSEPEEGRGRATEPGPPGRANDAGRERLRQAALAGKPWEHSTGPRTPEGKARSAANGKLTQIGEKSVRERRAEMAEIHALIGQMQALRGRLADRPADSAPTG